MRFALAAKATCKAVSHGALIMGEPGVGKTRIGLEWLNRVTDNGCYELLIIGPKNAGAIWKREADARGANGYRHSDFSVFVYPEEPDQVEDAIRYVHFEALPKVWSRLHPFAVVIDESHLLRNFKANVTKAMFGAISTAKYRLALSGSPVVNRITDLWPQLEAIRPGEWGTRFKFSQRYGGATHDGYGWKYDGVDNVEELQEKLRKTVFTIRKRDVLKELPPLTRSACYLKFSPTERREYHNAEVEVGADIGRTLERGGGVAEGLQRLTKLMVTLSRLKLDHAAAFIRGLKSKRILVWTWFEDTAFELTGMLSKTTEVVAVSGKTTVKFRRETYEWFEEPGAPRILISTMGASGHAVSLPSATDVVFVDLWWQPAMLLQAEQRAHRMNSTHAVKAHYLVAQGTVDEAIWKHLSRKAGVISESGLDDGPLGLTGIAFQKEEREQVLRDIVAELKGRLG